MNNADDQRRQAQKQQAAADTGLKRVKTAIDALTNEVKTYRTEQKTEAAQHKWPKRTAKAAIVYTGLTFIIMCVTAYQTYLVRSNNVVSERAFVSVGFGAGPTSYLPTFRHLTVADTAAEAAAEIAQVTFVANLTNSGNSGTKNLTFFLKCAAAAETLQEPWSILYQGIIKPTKGPQFIGPHATAVTVCSFSGDQIRAIAQKSQFGYIMLDATYQDRVSYEWRKTQATVQIAAVDFVSGIEPTQTMGVGLSAVLATYGKHNCADEECPE